MPDLRPLFSLLLCVPWLCASWLSTSRLAAQDDVLAVERREDQRGRDATVLRLKSMRSDFHFEAMSPREMCRLFAARTGDKLSFSLAAPAEEVADRTVSLELQQASLWTAMAVAQQQLGLRFVYRSGVVFLVPPAGIKPLTYVRVYDLRPQTAPLRNFPGPRLRLPSDGDDTPLFPEEEEPTTTVSGFTADGIEALLREHVQPESWDDTASMTNSSGLFVIRQTPQGHREVVALLIELGLIAPPRVVVRRPAPPLRPLRPRR